MRGPRQSGGTGQPDDLFDRAAQKMQSRSVPLSRQSSQASSLNTDGFIFSGNRHDSFPRSLLLDQRLTPLERNAWQVFRMLLSDDGITAFPTYDRLAPYLASTPCASRASHETVARALTMMRLTRWISLVRRHRDPKTGRITGNLYVLHDEPLTPYEAMQLDPEYLGLVSHALDHASRAIQRVGVHVLKEMSEDPMLTGKLLPTRLQVLTQRLSAQGWDTASDYPQAVDNHDSEEGEDRLRNRKSPSSDSEDSAQALENTTLRNPKTDRTVRIQKEESESLTTVPHARADLRLPDRFRALKPKQQSGALAALHTIDAALRQPILDEWEARCTGSAIRNPVGYLFGLIQKALHGEFNAWAATRLPAAGSSPAPPLSNNAGEAQTHIAELQSLLRFS